MKKIFSCLIAFILLLCCVGSAQAVDYNAENQFESNFVDYFTEAGCDMSDYSYNELFYHYDDNNEIDWCLISAACTAEPGMCHAVFGDIIITNAGSLYPFQLGLAVYDVVNNEFYDICTAWDMDFSQLHESFYDVMSNTNTEYHYGNVQVLGDVDKNGELNIADVTLIQKYLAEAVPRDDMLNVENSLLVYGSNLTSLSDYNKDGYIDIADVTAIQRRIADTV